jgi:hypothetical protein
MRRCAYCGGAVQPYFRFCCRLCAVFGTKRFNDYDAKAPCKLDTPEAERTFREKFMKPDYYEHCRTDKEWRARKSQ